jgi:threonine dehydrogenase-like Zn-dependent dehydrogenase
MKCVVIEKPHKVYLTERQPGPLAPGFARIRVMAAAICATDLEVVDGNIAANYPLTPGHEWSGIVAEVADATDAHWVGRRVTGSNDVSCGRCEACRSGNWRYCKDFEEIGFKRDGAYAEYIDVPAHGLVELPDGLPFTHAALAEPLGVALGTWEKIGPRYGGTCAVFGAGSIGLCCLSVAHAMGMRRIVVIDRNPDRLKVAEEMGAWATVDPSTEDLYAAMRRYHPEGTDYMIEATGAEECIVNSLKLCKKGGYVALAGYGRGKTMSIRMDDIHINNLHVVGAGNNWNQHQKAIRMMADGAVDMAPMVSETLALDEFQKGLDDARNRPGRFVKALFTFEES